MSSVLSPLMVLLPLLPLPLLPLPQEDPLPPADPAVTAEALEHHVRFLASDELAGRDTGSPELRRAADYLARALASYGLEGGAPEGGFLQTVPLTTTVPGEEAPELLVEMEDGTSWTGVHGRDFRLEVRGLPDEPRRLEVVLASPEDEPPPREEARAWALFLDAGARKGDPWLETAGLADGSALGLLVRRGSRKESKERPLGPSRLRVLPSGPDPADVIRANGRLLEGLRGGEVVALTLTTHASAERTEDRNVVGLLRGASSEAVVLSAHYDHVGRLAEGDGDVILNGADDDASGVAGVLELAEALAAGKKPERTLVVLLATGEERGLLGTEYYLDHPTVPLANTLLNLNLEMIGRPDELMPGPGHLWLTGWSETTLGPSLAGEDQPVHEDPRPSQNFYRRSDNYAFVRRGTMGQTLSSYGMHSDYHQVTDEADTLDYAHMETATRHALRVAEALVREGLAVEWAPGSTRR